ncbi:hypothetical protein CVAR21S_00926 [Corynebacterium variabile]
MEQHGDQVFRRIRHPAAEGDGRDTLLRRGSGDHRRGFAVTGLDVHAPLSGEHQIGSAAQFPEVHEIQQKFSTGFHPCVQDREEGRADTAGGSCPRHVPDCACVPATAAGQHLNPSSECLIERAEVLRRGTFLQPEDR